MPPTDSEANGNDRDVLTSLPRTRPSRRSAKRDRPARAGAPTAAGPGPADDPAAAAASDTPARAKARAAAKPKTTRPRAKAATASGGRSRSAAARTRATARTTAAPAAGRASAPVVPPAGYATSDRQHGAPDPFAVVSTAVQAAGEIAQIGATLWAQAVRSAVSRLPRP